MEVSIRHIQEASMTIKISMLHGITGSMVIVLWITSLLALQPLWGNGALKSTLITIITMDHVKLTVGENND